LKATESSAADSKVVQRQMVKLTQMKKHLAQLLKEAEKSASTTKQLHSANPKMHSMAPEVKNHVVGDGAEEKALANGVRKFIHRTAGKSPVEGAPELTAVAAAQHRLRLKMQHASSSTAPAAVKTNEARQSKSVQHSVTPKTVKDAQDITKDHIMRSERKRLNNLKARLHKVETEDMRHLQEHISEGTQPEVKQESAGLNNQGQTSDDSAHTSLAQPLKLTLSSEDATKLISKAEEAIKKAQASQPGSGAMTAAQTQLAFAKRAVEDALAHEATIGAAKLAITPAAPVMTIEDAATAVKPVTVIEDQLSAETDHLEGWARRQHEVDAMTSTDVLANSPQTAELTRNQVLATIREVTQKRRKLRLLALSEDSQEHSQDVLATINEVKQKQLAKASITTDREDQKAHAIDSKMKMVSKLLQTVKLKRAKIRAAIAEKSLSSQATEPLKDVSTARGYPPQDEIGRDLITQLLVAAKRKQRRIRKRITELKAEAKSVE